MSFTKLLFVTALVVSSGQASQKPSSPPDSTRLHMTLRDTVQAALTHNPTLAQYELATEQAQQEVLFQAGHFDTQVFSSLSYQKDASSTQGTQNMLATGMTRGQFEVGARKDLGFGGTLELGVAVVRARNQITRGAGALGQPRVLSVDEYFLQPRLSFRQKLLAGAGRRAARAKLAKAKAQKSVATAQRSEQARELLRSVVLGYWDLKSAQLELDIHQRALQIIDEQISHTQALIQEGLRADRDLVPLRLQQTLKQIELEQAKRAVRDRSVQLWLRMGIQESPGPTMHASSPLEPPSPNKDPASTEPLEDLSSHPKLRALQATLASNRVELSLARNRVRPQLDLVVSASTRGLSRDTLATEGKASVAGNWSSAFKNFFDGQRPPGLVDYSVHAGLEFRWSPRNRQARARAQQARLALSRNQLALKLETRKLRTRTHNAQREQASLHARWQIAQASTSLAHENLEIEQARFNEGYGTNNDLLLRLEALNRARRLAGQLQIDWIKSKVKLLSLRGELLAHLGVESIQRPRP